MINQNPSARQAVCGAGCVLGKRPASVNVEPEFAFSGGGFVRFWITQQ